MGAMVHFNHGEGKRISLHYSVTDLISSGKRSLACIALLCLSLEFTKMK